MEKQIKLFLEFLENDKKLSSNTLQSYKRDITQYQEYIDKNGLNYLKINNEDIDKYFESLKAMNKKTSTIEEKVETIIVINIITECLATSSFKFIHFL